MLTDEDLNGRGLNVELNKGGSVAAAARVASVHSSEPLVTGRKAVCIDSPRNSKHAYSLSIFVFFHICQICLGTHLRQMGLDNVKAILKSGVQDKKANLCSKEEDVEED